MSNTAVIILNWNGYNDTINCLNSLLPNLISEDYLFIIDNGSTDESLEKIKAYFFSLGQLLVAAKSYELPSAFEQTKKNYLIINDENLGFGAGNNVVLKQLKNMNVDFQFAWLLNNDTVVAKNTLSCLKYSLLNDNTIALSGSMILNYPDNGKIQCSGVNYYKFFGVSKLINKNLPLKEFDKNKKVKFDYLNGASIYIRLSALAKTGCFDESFFLYSEEYDLQLRFQDFGYKLYFNSDSIVYHQLSGGTRNKKHLFYYYYNSSALKLSKKHFSVFYTCCAIINLSIITFVRTFPSFKNFSWGIKGIIKGLKNN